MLRNAQEQSLPHSLLGFAQFCGFSHGDCMLGETPRRGETSEDCVGNAYSPHERLYRQIASTTVALGSTSFLIYRLGFN